VEKRQLYKIAYGLSVLTIISALMEAVVSLYFGYADETATLFGFGVDSLIETVSAIGIAHMITRIRHNNDEARDEFEKLALKVTGVSFFILCIGLVFTAMLEIITNHKPDTAIPGLIISLASIFIMLALMIAKLRVGRQLNSRPIIADANCTKVCIYMSVTLMFASLLYHITKIGYVDALGSMVIAYLSYREGSECFEKTKADSTCGSENQGI
jgi:divalent metal cation (Fe/Co/Zn/Cd) transporter